MLLLSELLSHGPVPAPLLGKAAQEDLSRADVGLVQGRVGVRASIRSLGKGHLAAAGTGGEDIAETDDEAKQATDQNGAHLADAL